MKRSRAEAATTSPAKGQRRQKASKPKPSAAGARARVSATAETARKGGGEDKSLAVATAEMQQSSPAPLAPVVEETMAWNDGAAEFGEWWWCLWGVEEEKLSGWFPFVDEDFLCSDTSGLERWGDLLWEEMDHDIWRLHHIHEIPHAARK
ncbi:hypothetical protein MUK42_33088 [Musa troglodytarum]|uniref:Uncharacterized protein n=1 Tax=Musa troglodytarum TaxID=320322 RepID=A0A9E7H9U3_9LILI|nr:hypothetical protein MUK42_15644 [Musa troglodytarum]URE35095.1 hypothetical protein MUK42_33088 [Musa troglodytarum]